MTQVMIDQYKQRLQRMRASCRSAAGYHRRSMGKGKPMMITLTYAGVDDWRPNHLTDFLRHVRRYLKRRGMVFRYAWVAELQRRGAVHYHVLVWHRGKLPKPDSCGWWPWGHTRIERCRFGGVGYITKYVSKFATKGNSFNSRGLPKGIRLFGAGGFVPSERVMRAWYRLPEYVRTWAVDPYRLPRRCVGGGWVCKDDGDWLDSPYMVVGFSCGFIWLAKKE